MTVSDTPLPASPSPASMPKRIASCARGHSIRQAPAQWVVAETLDSRTTPSVILDGSYQRRFANLNRASIATTATHARHLTPLVQRCAANGHAELDEFRLPSGATLRMIASPVLGPTDRIYGVSLWAGSPFDVPSPPPTVGAIEWDDATILATLSPALRTILNISEGASPSLATIPHLMARFDCFEDRDGLLALFDPTCRTDSWTTKATTPSTRGARRNLYIAAKRVPATNTIRALVCDISEIDSPPAPDSGSAALRRVPIAQGHAVGVVDLRDGLVHEWIADEPFASWRNRNPEIHPDDRPLVMTTCADLLSGTATATITARVRFSQNDDWMLLQATWTRITDGERPQALMDVTFAP